MEVCFVLYGYIGKIDSHREGDGFRYNIAGEIHFGDADNRTTDSLFYFRDCGKLQVVRPGQRGYLVGTYVQHPFFPYSPDHVPVG